MGWLSNLVLTVQVLCAIGIIVLVLLQQGKGADMGAAFGSGSSGSVFGSSGSANFLSRVTAVLATLFFIATLVLSLLATKRNAPEEAGSVMQQQGVPVMPATVPSSVPSSVPPSSSSVPSGVPGPSGSAGAAGAADQVPKK
jgi:preprotein translocase subunit SecG